uniref:Uncharacterized protein n=1 Tax=Anguilla anguilla TaxID=7936 RepID=A0A0E9S3M0_ANGAN
MEQNFNVSYSWESCHRGASTFVMLFCEVVRVEVLPIHKKQ